MLTHENAVDSREVGGAQNTRIRAAIYPESAEEINKKLAISDLVGSLRFVVDNLDAAAREATIAAEAIREKNVAAGHYHTSRFAAHARAACGAFRDLLDAPDGRAA